MPVRRRLLGFSFWLVVLCLLGTGMIVPVTTAAEVQTTRPTTADAATLQTNAICSGVSSEVPTVVAVIPGTSEVLKDGVWVYPGTKVSLTRCNAGTAGNLTIDSVPAGLELIQSGTGQQRPLVQVKAKTTSRIDLSTFAERGRILRVRTDVLYRSDLPGIDNVYFPPTSDVSEEDYRDREMAFLNNVTRVETLANNELNETAEKLKNPSETTSLNRLDGVNMTLQNVSNRMEVIRNQRQTLEEVLVKASWNSQNPSGLQAARAARNREEQLQTRIRRQIERYNEGLRMARSRARTTILIDTLSSWLISSIIGFGVAWVLMSRGAEAVRKDQRRSSSIELNYRTLWYRRRAGFLPKALVMLLTLVAVLSVLLALVSLIMRPTLLKLIGGV